MAPLATASRVIRRLLLPSFGPQDAGIITYAEHQTTEKRVRIASRQRLENLRYRSTVKTLQKRLEHAIADGDADKIATEHRDYVRTIDRAAARGALHKNTAARKKSQAARTVAGV